MNTIRTVGIFTISILGLMGCQTTSSFAQSAQSTPSVIASPSSQLEQVTFKKIKKAQNSRVYEQAVKEIFASV